MTDNVERPKPKFGPRKLVRSDDGLTIKQELFAQKLAAGVHFAQAWREAYNCENMNERSSYQKSFKDQKHPKIVKRVAELKTQINKLVETKLAGQDASASTLPAVREPVCAGASR